MQIVITEFYFVSYLVSHNPLGWYWFSNVTILRMFCIQTMSLRLNRTKKSGYWMSQELLLYMKANETFCYVVMNSDLQTMFAVAIELYVNL